MPELQESFEPAKYLIFCNLSVLLHDLPCCRRSILRNIGVPYGITEGGILAGTTLSLES